MRRIAPIALPLLLAISGCGGGAPDVRSGGYYTAASIKECLIAEAASVFENSAGYVDGDASGGTFHVEFNDDHATVAFARSEKDAIETARLAQVKLESLGDLGDRAHHRGNVAYWRLDETDASVRAVETCLEKTPSAEQPVESQL
jgi:hypothetical protein